MFLFLCVLFCSFMCYVTLESTSNPEYINGSSCWKIKMFEDNFFVESCYCIMNFTVFKKKIYVCGTGF